MKTIWKYPIEICSWQQIMMPRHSEVIRAALDPKGQPCVWALVYPGNPPAPVGIYVFGTGENVGDSCVKEKHIGSFNIGDYVWHVFLD